MPKLHQTFLREVANQPPSGMFLYMTNSQYMVVQINRMGNITCLINIISLGEGVYHFVAVAIVLI
jgi:hypothetical protein